MQGHASSRFTKVALIAIGNGTASRETERLVGDLLKRLDDNEDSIRIDAAAALASSTSTAPTAAAVANALYRFDGVRRTSLPMRDSSAAKAILGRSGRV